MGITREKFKIMGNVFDGFTEKLLFKLSSHRYFDELISPIYTGKESNVFSASKGDGLVIVKIYRLENCNFNQMFDYIKYDARYLNLAKKKRKIIFAWVQREFRNLQKARDAGVSVPKVHAFKDHVLVLDFIGDKTAAPMLKDVLGGLSDESVNKLYNDVIEQMQLLYRGGLVHGDLSGFNILYHNKRPVVIDFSQATVVKSLNSRELLLRDAKNIAALFKRHGISTSSKIILDAVLGKVI